MADARNMLGEAYQPVGKANFQFNDFLNDVSNVEEVKILITFTYNYLVTYFFKFY